MRCYACSELHHPDRCTHICTTCKRRKPGSKGQGSVCDCPAVRRLRHAIRPGVLLARVRRVVITAESANGS
jgi:hypothetical protein